MPLKTADDVIDALGGPAAAGRSLGIRPNTISMWRIRGQCPPEYFFAIADVLGEEPSRSAFWFHSRPKRRS